MAYRKTNRSLETLAKMRAGKARARMERPAPDYPPILPDLRRRIVIEDFDFGHQVHVLEPHLVRAGLLEERPAGRTKKEWRRTNALPGVWTQSQQSAANQRQPEKEGMPAMQVTVEHKRDLRGRFSSAKQGCADLAHKVV